jgi:NTE family protein
LSLLTGSVRSASVRGRRDSRLLRLSRDQFDTITAAEPAMLRGVAATVAGWLQTSRPRRSGRPSVVAVVAADEAAPVEAVAELLVAELSRHLSVSAPGRVEPSGLERAELSHDLVVLVAGAADEQWRASCLRQADRVVVVARSVTAPATA